MSTLVVGGGVFGLSTALALARRGAQAVTVLEAGRIPRVGDADADFKPGARAQGTSIDVSRMVRPDYAGDEVYTPLMLEAMPLWKRFNRDVCQGAPVFHYTGWLGLKPGCPTGEMPEGSFEALSVAAMEAAGVPVTRVTGADVRRLYPAWGGRWAEDDTAGFWHAEGGWGHSGLTVAHMAEACRRAGVEVVERAPVAEVLPGGRGVRLENGGAPLAAERVVVAAGLWTPRLVPELEGCMRSVAQPVFYVHVPQGARPLFAADVFPPFSADITNTGYYGFPINSEGVVKVGNHGTGEAREPEEGREVSEQWKGDFAHWLADTFPALAGARVETGTCFYEDSWDGHFYIDGVSPGVYVATGGSGHGYKFAPVVGDLVVDAMEGVSSPYLERFAFRRPSEEGEGGGVRL